MKNDTILKVFFSGIMIGGLFGVLFAPRKGSETRKKLDDKSAYLKDTIQKYTTELLMGSKNSKLEKINIENLKEMNKTSLI